MEKINRLARPARTATVSLAALAALALGGCSNSDKVAELEQRVTQAEAKAEAAEKRAKAAESFAQRAAPQPFPPNQDVGADQVDPDAHMVTDDSVNDPSFNNDLSVPVDPDGQGNDG